MWWSCPDLVEMVDPGNVVPVRHYPVPIRKNEISFTTFIKCIVLTNRNNEIKVFQIDGIAIPFHSVSWVDAMVFSVVTTSVPMLANVITSTWQMVHTFFANISNHLFAYIYLAQLYSYTWLSIKSLHTDNESCSSYIKTLLAEFVKW